MRTSRIIRAAQPSLVTVPDVEILEVGEDWETSTGVFTFTAEDLVSCIASQDDPALRTPVLKLGHVDPRFDGQPSFGRLGNLRLTNNNQTLVCDLMAMPIWLAEVMYTAYPRRSIEGQFDVQTRTGNKWNMILTGLALLGDSYPAVDTLEDIKAMWGDTPPPLFPVEDVQEIAASGSSFRARKVSDMPKWLSKKEGVVTASIALDVVRQEFYNSLDNTQAWWWIREVRVNPLALIVDDDMGKLWEVPVIASEEEVTFGEPVEVKIEYVAASGEPIVASQAGQLVAASHATPEESGRTSRPDPDESATLASATLPSTTDTEENTNMLTEEELAALGLAPDATREQISAAILGQTQEGESSVEDGDPPPAPEIVAEDPAVPEVVIPEGMVLVDASMLEEMRSGAAAATGLVQRQEKQDRDDILDTAIRAGKFPKGRREHYEALLSADPIGTKALIQTLEPGIVPVGEIGEQGDEVAAAAETAYPTGWKRTVEAGRRPLSDRVKVVQD